MILAPVWLAMALAAPQQNAAAQAPQAPTEWPVSLSRIRAGLARPIRLRIATPEPTYRVEIQQHPFFTDVPRTWTFDGGGVPFSATPFGTSGSPAAVQSGNLLPLFGKVQHAIEQHAAEEEVRRAIADFCATHSCDR
jgi:hypothetical protein